MQDRALSLMQIFERGRRLHASSTVTTVSAEGTRTASFGQVADRAEAVARGLRNLGMSYGDRIATLCWNHQEHLELYLATPLIGATLHTVNVRLHDDEIVGIINDAQDRILVIDGRLVHRLATILQRLSRVEHVVVVERPNHRAPDATLPYEQLLNDGAPLEPVEQAETDAAQICYTSGTTGRPRGVAYSHRSAYLHSLMLTSTAGLGVAESDRVLLVVPMYHASAWGLPFAAWWVGADIILPEDTLRAETLADTIITLRPTLSAGVPTVWADLVRHLEARSDALGCFRLVLCGGAAMPQWLAEAFDRAGGRLVQGWGMTETSPLAAIAHTPKAAPDGFHAHLSVGRPVPGVEVRIVGEDGSLVEWGSDLPGEIEVRGPWITGSYLAGVDADRFDDGWLRTGDLGSMDQLGSIRIRDRIKDVIKSGGEWISPAELERVIEAHPEVRQCCVVGVPDDRWQERPLAIVVREAASTVDAATLQAFISDSVARWWIPTKWHFTESIPATSVGKMDKVTVRAQLARGDLSPIVVEL